MYETILYESKNAVARITLNRPEKVNSFNKTMNIELLKALKQAATAEEVRAIMITGTGRAFCAGQDLSEVDEKIDHGELLKIYYNPLIEEMAQIGKPIIAAVNGTAAGAGFSLALAADFRLVSDKASFLNAFIHVGLIPDSGNFYYLPRMVGHAKAMELMMLGEKIRAEEAKMLGLATKLIPTEKWEAEITAFTERLAFMPTKAMALIKKNLLESWERPLSATLEQEAYLQRVAGLTADHQEGVKAFLEKRPPQFQGR
ncbi:enoyl-CoA hydratase-related protein [Lederbergia citrea]|uniref:Enoyl-CoA hydratase/isomerase family protein n=1 Tax=Lederbergia citrea TaxID=2833581 RepID=A0A942UQJ3_9BACI|nr:enoyl-CoA hydratase-related protein [Lederbergia citrea]MBS4204246.1 enoyl-CoA hydratase/isomerase family protein [Lederbergia citrea]MBS4221169.1 enoyl-CoA hydratase/isomerase family protein [Lederbergia citrea]